jgi:hypothetical protein
MEHLSVHGPEGSDAAPQQCHAPEPPPIVFLIAFIAHYGQVLASVGAIAPPSVTLTLCESCHLPH